MALAELRNLSATSYFRSATSLLPVLGGDPEFTASVLLRELGPTSSTQWICGNVNLAGTAGWSFVRLSDSSSGATHNYTFTVFEAGVAQALTFAVRGSIGKMMLFHLVYTGTAQTVYVNGIEVATAATAGDPISLSTGRFSIGYDFNGSASPNPDMGFVAFGYGPAAFTATQISENTLSIIKSQEISSAGLPSALTNVYSVARDSGSGVPSTLRNFGTTTITLEVVGRAGLSLSSPPSFLGDSAVITSSGGGGDVSGPGASTNNAVATWDGVTGDALLNTVVTIDPVSGNIATPGTVDGRDISVDGAKLDTIAVGATNTPLSNVAPVNVTKAAASAGVAVEAARQDHKHDVTTAAAGTIAVGDVAAEGAATSLARSDHTHALPAPVAPANVTKSAASAGAATTVARADHKHDVTTAAAVTITNTTNAEGVATSLARSDHTHAHGNLSGGTLHDEATDLVAGFMSAADKAKLDSIPGGGGGGGSGIYEIYVSAVNGNDANDGATPGTAVATISRARELAPAFPVQAVFIHFGSGSYVWTDINGFFQSNNAPVYLIGDGAGQPGDDGFVVAVSATAQAGSTATTINSSVVLPSVNSYAGYTVEFTSGAQQGQRKLIRDNTTTALTVASRFESSAVGDTFDIKASDVQIVLPEGANISPGTGFSQTESPLILINLRFSGSTFETSLRVSNGHVLCYGVSFDEGGLTCVNSTIHAGTLYADATSTFGSFGGFLPFQENNSIVYLTQQLSLLGASSTVWNWEGWGLSCLRDTDEQLPLIMDSGQFIGFLVGSQLTISPASSVALVGGAIIDNGQTSSGQIINNGGFLYIQGTLTQRNASGVVNVPGVPFYLSTGAISKFALQTVNGGYTQVDDLLFSTNSSSTSILVDDTGTFFSRGLNTGLQDVGSIRIASNAIALFEGEMTTTGTGTLTVDRYSTCLFDGPTGTWEDVVVSWGSTFATGTGTASIFTVNDDVTVSQDSFVQILANFDIGGTITLTDSRMTIDNSSAFIQDLGVLVSLTDSTLTLNCDGAGTVRINTGGSGSATALSMSRSKFIQLETPIIITGRVAMTQSSEWLCSGSTGTITTGRIDCFNASEIKFAISGSLNAIDTVAAPSLNLVSSKFQFNGTALAIGNSVDAELVASDNSVAAITTTGAVTVTGNITLEDSELSVNDGTDFTITRSMTMDNSRLTVRSIEGDISTGFIARNSHILQSACTFDIDGGVQLLHGSSWTARGALGGTSTWGGGASAGLLMQSGSIFDNTGVTDGGSHVFDANTPVDPVQITSGSRAHFRTANIDITGAPALAAMVLTFGGSAYFTGALTGFTATGDDFALDGNTAFDASYINTYFTTIPGAPVSNFATPGSPALVQFTAFVMRIS